MANASATNPSAINPNAIVGLISRIEPPVTQSGAEMLRQFREAFSVELEGEKPARLHPSEKAAAQLEILEGLRALVTPVYLEIDPETRAITRLLIPLVSEVVSVGEERAEEITVELARSHARHVLRRGNNAFPELMERVRVAIVQHTPQIVTETDQHEIIDVRPHSGDLPSDRGVQGAAVASLGLRRRWWPWRFWHWLCWFCWFCRCVTPARAKDLFDLCSAQTCNPTTVPAPCIPFLYPDDGCWARAHEMCRLMLAQGAHPRKIWISGNLHTPTKNNPACFVNWGWHVAPTLCVRTRLFRHIEEVIDPSLFNVPVSEVTWKGVQGDANATLTPTAASVYMRPSQTDPTYSQTNFYLNFYRLQLKNRSLSAAGPPPYAQCP
jgi:Glutaminase